MLNKLIYNLILSTALKILSGLIWGKILRIHSIWKMKKIYPLDIHSRKLILKLFQKIVNKNNLLRMTLKNKKSKVVI